MDNLLSVFFTKEAITQSFEKVLAKGTEGIDGVDSRIFREKREEIIESIFIKINGKNFEFSPYLLNLKLKGRDKLPRAISIPTMRDRVVLDILKNSLREIFYDSINQALPNQVIHEAKKCLKAYGEDKELRYLKVDIKEFYDSINHPILLRRLDEKLNGTGIDTLIEKAIQNPVTASNERKGNRRPNWRGVHQGLAISNILAEIYMHNVEEHLKKNAVFYHRYVDDILILYKADNHKLIMYALESVIINKLSLSFHPVGSGKTENGLIIDKVAIFDYLGYSFYIPKNKILRTVGVKAASKQNIMNSLMGIISKYKSGRYQSKFAKEAPLEETKRFMRALNIRITGCIAGSKTYGWLFHYSEIEDLSILRGLDYFVRSKLMKFPEKEYLLKSLKTFHKTYYEIKFNKKASTYITRYPVSPTAAELKKILLEMDAIDPLKSYSLNELNNIYNKALNKITSSLEEDISGLS